jgi:N-methylhydantoinase A/oxoprolinase/acetone carboxylase beta subunit
MESKGKFQFAIDRGGTFTDIYARCPGGKIRVMKLLSVDPANYPDAPREGIRRILEEVSEMWVSISEVSDLTCTWSVQKLRQMHFHVLCHTCDQVD